MAKLRPRQRHLPHTDPEPKPIPAIEEASDAYVEARDRRMALTRAEVDTKAKLRDIMKKHGLKKYEYSNKIVKFMHEKEADVKVKVRKPPKEKKGKKVEA